MLSVYSILGSFAGIESISFGGHFIVYFWWVLELYSLNYYIKT